MLAVAFKEWAVICRALAAGRQRVILRKGGIAEAGGVFTPDHDRFWLYPTHFHEQQQAGVKPEFLPLLAEAEAERAAPGTVVLTHFAQVTAVTFVDDLDALSRLDPLHAWTAEVTTQRFHYRRPGLYVLGVDVFRAREPVTLVEQPGYAGCKTWVQLDPPPAADADAGATMVSPVASVPPNAH